MAKLTVEFNDRMNQMLEDLAAKDKTTKVSVIRRALALYKFVEEEVKDKDKRRLAITEGEKVIKEIVVS
ncbi:MAG: hypothetical protein Q8O86_00910 [Dehalococcoidia bacterium]|nr:hypothetical protein [Dehalococcoidia bacterium]